MLKESSLPVSLQNIVATKADDYAWTGHGQISFPCGDLHHLFLCSSIHLQTAAHALHFGRSSSGRVGIRRRRKSSRK